MIRVSSKGRRQAAYEPTPQEIERACAEIRSQWSQKEQRKRLAEPRGGAAVPQYSLRELRSAVDRRR